jgi:hypothetical protein
LSKDDFSRFLLRRAKEGSHTMNKLSTKGILRMMGLLLLLVVSAPALGDTDDEWLPPVNLSGWQHIVIDFQLRLGSDGTKAAFWLEQSAGGQWSLWARVQPPGGEWGLPENLSGTREQFPDYFPDFWDTGVTPGGTAWLVWAGIDTAQSGDNLFVMASRLPPGGSWQSELLTPAYETTIRWVDLDVGPGGDLAAAWVACASTTLPSDGPCHVRVRRRPAGAPGWQPLAQPDEAIGVGITQAGVLVGPGGLTVALWEQADTSTPARWAVMARAFEPAPAPGAWDPNPINLSGWKPSMQMSWPVMDPGGTLTAAWVANSADPAKVAVFASTRSPAGGAWSQPPTPISTARSGMHYRPHLGVGQDGTVAATWGYIAPTTETYFFANARDAGSVWGSEAQLFGGPLVSLRLWNWRAAVGSDGTAIALYSHMDSSHHVDENEVVRWSGRPPHGVWGGAGQGELGDWVSSIQSLDLAAGKDGHATAVWGPWHAGRPQGEQWRILAAIRPPESPFGPATDLSGWHSFAETSPGGLVVGPDGRQVLAGWRIQRLDDSATAFQYSEFTSTGPRIYLPLIVRQSP